VCSEVHSFVKETEADGDCEEGCQMATFVFTPPQNFELHLEADAPPEEAELAYDSDGDVEVPRRDSSPPDLALLLEHRLTTCLSDVGLQVWRGSLLLADYLLHNHRQFKSKNVLEVGSGTALASIVAASCGAKVLSTDLDQSDILQLMKRNVKRNRNFIQGTICVEALDLFGQINDVVEDFIKDTNIVIAGDIVYDNKVTESFVGFIKTVMTRFEVEKRSFIIAMEKRFVFTIEDLDTVAPAYDYFLDLLNQLQSDPPLGYSMHVEQIDTNFPQYFCYERVKEMVLLNIYFCKN